MKVLLKVLGQLGSKDGAKFLVYEVLGQHLRTGLL